MIFSFSPRHLRFVIKLICAVVLSVVAGFYFQLQTPRWAVMTAALVTAGPAFAAGGEPYSGAIRYRSMLRIIGTVVGCVAGLVMVTVLVRVPLLLMLAGCLWTGFCTWISSLVRVENSYAFGLSGYTALIIVLSAQLMPMESPQYALERCSEILVGICCAVIADLLFSPRSVKQEIDKEMDNLLVMQYRLMQLCLAEKTSHEAVDKAWGDLVRRTNTLDGMRSNLKMESSRWVRANRRLKVMNTLSLTLITHAVETCLVRENTPQTIAPEYREYFAAPVENIGDVHKSLKFIRRALSWTGERETPPSIYNWVAAATRYLLLKQGVISDAKISSIEEEILRGEVVVKPPSAERHHAMVNFWRTTLSSVIGTLFWLWTGWTAGGSTMMMIAIVTALAMRMPNPRMVAIDFLVGAIAALPIGTLGFLVILPATQQSLLLLCLSLSVLAFLAGIEVQKRRLGSLGALVSTLNIINLSNPMNFHFSAFLDNALGQIVGCFLALIVILLVRDNSRLRTGRALLNQFVSAAVSCLTTNKARRKENHLPALYRQLFMLMSKFPGDADKFHLALNLIVAHQHLRHAPIPVNEALSVFHRQLRNSANQVVNASSDEKRRDTFQQLLVQLADYQQLLENYQVQPAVREWVQLLTQMLSRYQAAFTSR